MKLTKNDETIEIKKIEREEEMKKKMDNILQIFRDNYVQLEYWGIVFLTTLRGG